jgi:hypothetical protein
LTQLGAPETLMYEPAKHWEQAAATAAEYLPATHEVHAVDAAKPEYWPAPQAPQVNEVGDATVAEYRPVTHSTQAEEALAAWYWPAAHERQLAEPDAALYLPVEQSEQAVELAALYSPVAQLLHVEPERYLPAAHAMHIEDATLPVVVVYEPEGQSEQLPWPAAAWYELAAHEVHPAAAVAAYLPDAQLPHAEAAAAAAYLPAAQFVQLAAPVTA